jgi:hypothetical protein
VRPEDKALRLARPLPKEEYVSLNFDKSFLVMKAWLFA